MYERFAGSTKFSGGMGYRLTNDVIEMLRKGNLQAALEELGNKLSKNPDARNKMAGQIIKLISKLGLKTKIVISKERLSNYDLGQYDPMTDTITLDFRDGLSVTTLLHEVLHAASVKVMNLYMTGKRGQLSERQIKGVEQILKIMRQTQIDLEKGYPQAYENPFEFLAYALSDRFFQAELEATGVNYGGMQALDEALEYGAGTEPIYTILPQEKNMWSAFKRAIAGILGVPIGATKVQSFMLELNAALEDIASAPIEPVDIGPMSAKKPKQPKQAGTPPAGHTAKTLYENDPSYNLREDQKPKGLKYWKELFTTIQGWHRITEALQNKSYEARARQRRMELAGQLIRTGPDLNNFDDQLTIASSLARNNITQYISEPVEKLNDSIVNFAKSIGVKTEEALNVLHRVIEALHEPERRMIKYLLNVPLSTTKLLPNGMSAANFRDAVVKLLEDKKLSTDEAQAKKIAQDLRKVMDSVVFQTDAQGNIVYKNGYPQPSAYVDPLGASPARLGMKNQSAKLPTDFENDQYMSTGLNQDDVKSLTNDYQNHPHKAEIDAVLSALKEVTDATAKLNKEARYWSTPVDNLVNFYGYKYYAPFKGRGVDAATYDKNSNLSFHRYKKGNQFQELPQAAAGRGSVSDNPFLQAMVDATRSGLRSGLKDVTLAVKNAIDQKLIKGRVETVKFADRDKAFEGGKHKGQRTIFHYKENGDIDILHIDEITLLDAIRHPFEENKPLLEFANGITSWVGKQHTRYNFQFAPMNFVRDALTNAFTMGADMGPIKSLQFLKDVSSLVVAHNGLYKALEVAILYEKNDANSQAALKQLAKTDPYYGAMIEMIEEGGLVSYLQSLSIKSNFQELHKQLGRSGIMTKKEQFEKFVDTWTDMFEIASRAAAYRIAKDDAIQNGESVESAKVRAATYAKNLANFEQVGHYGKVMGAAYMFSRPAATGAVRTIEAIAPAFTPLSWAEKRLPPDMNPQAKEPYLKNYKKLQRNGQIMTGALIGSGMVAYAMASMFSDDDDLGRNSVATDNMQQWTRFARFHIPRKLTEAMGIKEPVVFQIP